MQTHDFMMAWVSLVHAGSWLPAQLSAYLEDELGISLPEQDLLSQLDKAGGQIGMSELADRLFLSKPGMTRMVDRLERKQLIRRVRSDRDRRSVSAKLTRKGANTLRRSRALLVPWVEKHFASHLGARDVRALDRALSNLLKGLGRWEGQLEHLSRPKKRRKRNS